MVIRPFTQKRGRFWSLTLVVFIEFELSFGGILFLEVNNRLVNIFWVIVNFRSLNFFIFTLNLNINLNLKIKELKQALADSMKFKELSQKFLMVNLEVIIVNK